MTHSHIGDDDDQSDGQRRDRDRSHARAGLAGTHRPRADQAVLHGADVETDWKPRSAITWKGEYQGQSYEDKGEIVEVVPEERLQHTHFSPMSGQPDEPENYHTLTYTLSQRDAFTKVVLTQDNNGSEEDAAGSSSTWAAMLEGLKKTVESQ